MKKTRFNDCHKKLGAKMVEFVGWEMPIEYSGIIAEHLAVRHKAGLFDVSHMGEIYVEGKDALGFVQYLTPNDAGRLAPGQIQYTALMTPQGTFVDDMLVYCLGLEHYLFVVNAANADKDFKWIVDHMPGFDVRVENASDRFSQLAIQGPKAQDILQPLVNIDLTGMKSFTFAYGKMLGKSVLVSRTGYTGEDGFEIYTVDPDPAVVWDILIEKGKPAGLLPIGLGARDTLRLEAKLSLYGNDIDETTTVLEADLKWIVKFKKGDFLGKDVLVRQSEGGIRRMLVGFELMEKGIPRPHYPVYFGGEKVAEVRSGTFSPLLKKSIGLVYLPMAATGIGTEFEVGIRDKKVRAQVVPTPFYKRP
jgi:aminomethyltransferase